MDTRLESDRVTSEKKNILDQWGELFIQAGEEWGCKFDVAREHKMKEILEAADVIDIVEKPIIIECGGWPRDVRFKETGILIQFSIEKSLDNLASYLGAEMLGWLREEVTVLVAMMRSMVQKRSNCSLIKAYVNRETTIAITGTYLLI